MDKINSSLSLKDYLQKTATQNNITLETVTEGEEYKLISKVDPHYELRIFTSLPIDHLAISYVEFGDISFVDAQDETFRIIINRLIVGDYKVRNTPVSKYLKYTLFFIDFNNKRLQFYNDDGAEIKEFDYRVTENNFPVSYYTRWPDVK